MSKNPIQSLQWCNQDGLLEFCLVNPQFGNSFGSLESKTLSKVLKEHRKNLKGLVFTAKGRVFCSGGNLKLYKGLADRQAGIRVNQKIRHSLSELAQLPVPKLALVSGDCFGGGLELISAFDHVIAAPQVMFGFWQRRIGLSFGWGGGHRLGRRLGTGKLLSLAKNAQKLGAYEALQIGLVDEVCANSLLAIRGKNWLASQAALPSAPLRFFSQWKESKEAEYFEKLWLNPDHKKALSHVVPVESTDQ